METPHCISCSKKLEEEITRDSQDDFNRWSIVYGGIFCRSRGNYGSTIYDPMDVDEYLEFFLCDDCIKSKSSMIDRVIAGVRREPMSKTLDGWNKRREQYDEFLNFQNTLIRKDDKRMTVAESRVLWALQGLQPGLQVHYKYEVGGVNLSFAIPSLQFGIKIIGSMATFRGSIHEFAQIADKEAKEFHEASKDVPWKILLVRLSDMYLRSPKKYGKMYDCLPMQLRDKIVDAVGQSNYAKVPDPEPEYDS